MERRVVVTGLGTVNPIAHSIGAFGEALRAGVSGGGPITLFDASTSPVRIGCEVKDFDPEQWMDRKAARRTSRFIQFAVAAARQAVEAADLDIAPIADRVGASIASGIGGMDIQLVAHRHFLEKGFEQIGRAHV